MASDGAAASSGWAARAWRAFRDDRAAMVASVVLLIIAVAAALAPWVAPFPEGKQSSDLLLGPSWRHLLGTDELGRDQLSRIIFGARESLLVAFGSAAIALAIGLPIGLTAGYLGRVWDAVAMRLMDLVLALPGLLIGLIIVTVLGPSTLDLILAIGVAGVPVFARLARASVLGIRDHDFVVASRAMGATPADTMCRTILPNILGPIVIQFVVSAAVAVVVAAALSFLGLGPAPPTASWGGMLQASKAYVYQNAWYGIFPGIALAITIACLDRIGHGLQRAFGGRRVEVIRDGA
jgi:peptide/nickel transport system permease protein